MTRWQLQEAKNRLSELVRKARAEGPQMITMRGDDTVVVLAAEDFRKLAGQSKGDLVEFIANSPLKGIELDLTRDRSTGRKIRL